ncbi:MetQ/NlpA family ABC transporter substrate-binding protein, partial [Intestinimonas sp.]|uniref:MetQ/NlpA family ABC transporter substrate-binding protein n=1 Tax=Intestinimonas sp. TaxID=1965293 RepID=UPI003AAD594A
MKKFVSLLLTGALACALLAGCGGGNTASPSPSASAPATSAPVESSAPAASNPLEGTVLKVGATPAPHAEILEVVKGLLAEQGITLEIVEFNDYIQP